MVAFMPPTSATTGDGRRCATGQAGSCHAGKIIRLQAAGAASIAARSLDTMAGIEVAYVRAPPDADCYFVSGSRVHLPPWILISTRERLSSPA